MDNLVAETAAYLNILHPDYGRLAARIAVTKLHKETDVSFLEVVKKLYFYRDSTGKSNTINISTLSMSMNPSLINLFEL
jgi:hypothetical protein